MFPAKDHVPSNRHKLRNMLAREPAQFDLEEGDTRFPALFEVGNWADYKM